MIIVIRIGPTAPGLRPMASHAADRPRPCPSEPNAAAMPIAKAAPMYWKMFFPGGAAPCSCASAGAASASATKVTARIA